MKRIGIKIPGHNGKCLPTLRDPNEIFPNDCGRLAGGVKKPGAPDFTPGVSSPETDVLQEDDGIPIREDDGQFFTNE